MNLPRVLLLALAAFPALLAAAGAPLPEVKIVSPRRGDIVRSITLPGTLPGTITISQPVCVLFP